MKKSSIKSRLNFFHLLHFGSVIALVFVSLFLISGYFLKKQTERFLGTQIQQIDNSISFFCSDIEYFADKISIDLSENASNSDYFQIISAFACNYKNEIDTLKWEILTDTDPNNSNDTTNHSAINSFPFDYKGFYWIKDETDSIPSFSLFYHCQVDSMLKMVIKINKTKLEESILNSNMPNFGHPVLLDNHNQPLLFSSNYSENLTDIISSGDIENNETPESSLKYIYNKNFKKEVIASIIYNTHLKGNIVLFLNPDEHIVEFFSNLIVATFIVLGLIFILGILQISLTNKRQTQSLRNLIKYLTVNSGQDLRIEGDETKILRKHFEKLQNQLDIVEKNQEKISQKNSKLENDLKLAKKLQRNLMPTITPKLTSRKEFDLYALSEPAFDIGGDLVDYFLIDDDHLLLVVGDVAGKGIPASLYMIYTHTLLRNISTPGFNVSDIMDQLNNRLIEENISDMFVTFFLGMLEVRTGTFHYCNAAHNLPLVIYSDGRVEELSDIHGIPLGIYPNRKYTFSTISLKAKDQVFIYSDGVTDSVDESGMKYSLDVLKYNLMGSWFDKPNKIGMKIKKSIDNFRGNLTPEDDITMLIFQYMPEKEVSATNSKS